MNSPPLNLEGLGHFTAQGLSYEIENPLYVSIQGTKFSAVPPNFLPPGNASGRLSIRLTHVTSGPTHRKPTASTRKLRWEIHILSELGEASSHPASLLWQKTACYFTPSQPNLSNYIPF